jgi:hypothetical protein
MVPVACDHPRINSGPDGAVCRVCGARLAAPAPPSRPLEWRLTAGGAVIAIVIQWWGGLVLWILGMLSVLVHELGHAVVAWSTGHPAIPRFDLHYGGGVTSIGCRSGLISLLLVAAGIWLLVLAWKHGPAIRAGAIAVVAGPLLLAVTGWDEAAFSLAGILGELVFAGIFVVRGLTGRAVAHRLEGWLYAICGWTMWLNVLLFAWRLATDGGFQAAYAEGKGGLDNDLTVIAGQLGGSVSGWAWGMLGVALVALAVTGGVAGRMRRG